MARLALRQFLRSSFDPGDKTMASPIIACFSAVTLLILASCSFDSITATRLSDTLDDESRRTFSNLIQTADGTLGYVKRYADDSADLDSKLSYDDLRPIGSRSFRGRGAVVRGSTIKQTLDYVSLLGRQLFMFLEVIAKHISKSIMRILSHLNNHANGAINVPAQTPKGEIIGKLANSVLSRLTKAHWAAAVAHICQEAVDSFYLIGRAFFAEAAKKGCRGESDTEDYTDVSLTAATLQIDMAEDFDQWEINEYEDPVTKTYHCSAQSQSKNDTLQPNLEMIKFLDDNGLAAVRPKKNYYQTRQIRQKMCQFGFDPFDIDTRSGSIHKRFKNTLRLMIYNTPGMFPGLKVIRNDLDRKRKREPQIWFKFETANGPLVSEFDYDNYFVTVNGDFSRIQAYSKMLVALKMHKRLNSFNDSVSYKINLDLGIIEVILSTFGIAVMREKSTTRLMVKALNGVRTEIKDDGEVQLEFEESLKEAADQVDPLLYSTIWLLSMAEKYEVVRIRDRS